MSYNGSMKILLICGSIAQNSHTKALLKYIENLLNEYKCKTILWDLKEKPLSIALPQYHRNPWQSPDKSVREFVKVTQESNGFVLGSPIYHGSFSGVLKNALDNLHFDAFRDKPVGLVSNSSTIRNCTQPAEHLRPVVRALYGYALQTHIGTVTNDYEMKEDALILTSEEIQERCVRLVEELLHLASLFQK